MAVTLDSVTRTNARPARNSFLTKPWLLNRIAKGGPEMVVTEYRTPRAVPNGRPISHADRIGLRQPAACTRISGRITVYVPNLTQPGCSEARISAPTPMPGNSPISIGRTLFQTAGTPFRLMIRTYNTEFQ